MKNKKIINLWLSLSTSLKFHKAYIVPEVSSASDVKVIHLQAMFFQLVMNTTTFHCVSLVLSNVMELSFFSEVPTNIYEASSKCNKYPSLPPHYSAKIITNHAVNEY